MYTTIQKFGVSTFFGISFLKEINAFIQQGLILCINTHMYFFNSEWFSTVIYLINYSSLSCPILCSE